MTEANNTTRPSFRLYYQRNPIYISGRAKRIFPPSSLDTKKTSVAPIISLSAMVGVRNGGRGEGGKRRGAGEPFSPSTAPIFPRKKSRRKGMWEKSGTLCESEWWWRPIYTIMYWPHWGKRGKYVWYLVWGKRTWCGLEVRAHLLRALQKRLFCQFVR